MSLKFPVFDLASFENADTEQKQLLGRDVDHVCRTSGFLAISNHGVPDQTIRQAWGTAHEFFDLPPDVKQRAKAPYEGYPYGYLGPELEALARSRGLESLLI